MPAPPPSPPSEFERSLSLLQRYAKIVGYEVNVYHYDGPRIVIELLPPKIEGKGQYVRVRRTIGGPDPGWAMYYLAGTDINGLVKPTLEASEDVHQSILEAVARGEAVYWHHAEKEKLNPMTTATTTPTPPTEQAVETPTPTKDAVLSVLKIGRRSFRGSVERRTARRLNRQLIKALRKMTPADQQHLFEIPAVKLGLPFLAPIAGLLACNLVSADPESRTLKLAQLISERALDSAFDGAAEVIEPVAWKLIKEFARAARVNNLASDLIDDDDRPPPSVRRRPAVAQASS